MDCLGDIMGLRRGKIIRGVLLWLSMRSDRSYVVQDKFELIFMTPRKFIHVLDKLLTKESKETWIKSRGGGFENFHFTELWHWMGARIRSGFIYTVLD